jgi:NitT/TauT family transport system ATP-binding protein
LEDINFRIGDNEFIALVGPSGCGKSTIIRILAGLLEPTDGVVYLDGESPSTAAAKKKIGWLAQNPALLPWRTVLSNVALAQRINPQKNREMLFPDELLEIVGLSDYDQSYPFMLSGGQQQRVALARTLALGADVWLMDEPFAALDELTREALTRELLGIWRKMYTTVIWVTHHILEAVYLADRVMVLSERPGRLIADIKVDMERPRTDSSLDFQRIVKEVRGVLLGSRDDG